MSWTTPRTWVDGETTTLSLFNQYLRDELTFLFQEPSACIVNRATQSIPTGADTAITFGTRIFDTSGAAAMTLTTANAFTIPTGLGGKYVVGLGAGFASAAGTTRRTKVLQNAVVKYQDAQAGAAQQLSNEVVCILNCAAADVITFTAFQDSGVAVNLVGSTAPDYWSQMAYIYRVGT